MINQEKKLPKVLREIGYLFAVLFVIWLILAIWGLFLTDKSGLGGVMGFIVGPIGLLFFFAMLIKAIYAAIYDRTHFKKEVNNAKVSGIEKGTRIVLFIIIGILVLIIGKSAIKFFQ